MTEEKKLILMTKAALCRQQKCEEDLRITRFYKRDYLVLHGILAWFHVTVAFIMIAALWLFYLTGSDGGTYLLNQVTGLVVIGILIYVAVCIGYVAFAVNHYLKRYQKAEQTAVRYQGYLEQIQQL